MPNVSHDPMYLRNPLENADPSILTTAALQREVGNLEKEMIHRSEDRRVEMENLQKLVETQIKGLSDLMNEQLASIKTQFELIEKQRVEQKKDTKDAVDAALIAQKEAVQEQTIASGLSIAKSEAATAKQLDQLAVTFTNAITGVTGSINDLKDGWTSSIGDVKDRVGKIESLKQGAQEQVHKTQSNLSAIYGFGGFVLVLLTIMITLAASGIIK
jgi:hypothetical protein